MKLKVIQLNFGYRGGSATAYVYGPDPGCAFERRPYMAVHINFTLHSDQPKFDLATQDLVVLPDETLTPFLLVGFLSDPPMFAERDLRWPHPNEYRNKLTHAIARMVAVAVETDATNCLQTQ